MKNEDKLLPNPDSEIVLRPPKKRLILLIITAFIFVAGGIWMLMDNEPMGWLVAGFFGLCLITFVVQCLPNSTYIRLSREGFETKTLYKTVKLKWEETRDFAPIYVGRNHLVGFNFTDEYKGTAKLRGVNKNFYGYESCTPIMYEMKAHDLASLMLKLKVESMNSWR